MQARTDELRHFEVPQTECHVEFISFLASLRPGYQACLKRVWINRHTAEQIAGRIPEAKLWPLNQHGVVLSFLHYKFYLNDELENAKFAINYSVQAVNSEQMEYPGIYHGRKNEPSHLFNERYHM